MSGLDAHLDGGFSDRDPVAVFEVHVGILALGSLLRGFALFAPAPFFAVHVGAIHAAQIAQ